ncbi:hypothetical protein VR010_11740 [Actinomycetaceae bacterium L2_0104]
MNKTTGQRNGTQNTAQIISWVVSLATLAVGLFLYFTGKSSSVTAQVGASDGTITDPNEYYQRVTDGSSAVTLGSALIAVSIVVLVLTLALFTRPVVAVESRMLATGDRDPHEPEIADPDEAGSAESETDSEASEIDASFPEAEDGDDGTGRENGDEGTGREDGDEPTEQSPGDEPTEQNPGDEPAEQNPGDVEPRRS